jgi:hypothetical protein
MGDAPSIDAEISSLQAQIGHTEEQIRWLRTRRNACSPLCSLPFDVLHIIFQLLAPSSPESDRDADVLLFTHEFSAERTEFWPFMGLAAACTRLRAFAIATPLLWHRADLGHRSSEWVALCVARAGSVPLSLRCDRRTMGTLDPPAIQSLTRQIQARVRDIRLWNCADTIGFAFEDTFRSEDASFRSISYSPGLSHEFTLSKRAFSLPARSSLTSLELAYTRIGPEPPHLPHLLSLKLAYECSGFEHIAHLLQNCPQLERLNVRGFEPVSIHHDGPPIALDHLRVLIAAPMCLSLLLAVLAPQMRCTIVLEPCAGFHLSLTEAEHVRKQSFDSAVRWLGLAAFAHEAHVYSDTTPMKGPRRYRLEVRDPQQPLGARYLEYAEDLQDFESTLAAMRRLHLWRAAFGAFANSKLGGRIFAQISELVIEEGTPARGGDCPVSHLRHWLIERASRGAQLDVLSFVRCEHMGQVFGPFEQIVEIVRATGAVLELHRDGRIVYSLDGNTVR